MDPAQLIKIGELIQSTEHLTKSVELLTTEVKLDRAAMITRLNQGDLVMQRLLIYTKIQFYWLLGLTVVMISANADKLIRLGTALIGGL